MLGFLCCVGGTVFAMCELSCGAWWYRPRICIIRIRQPLSLMDLTGTLPALYQNSVSLLLCWYPLLSLGQCLPRQWCLRKFYKWKKQFLFSFPEKYPQTIIRTYVYRNFTWVQEWTCHSAKWTDYIITKVMVTEMIHGSPNSKNEPQNNLWGEDYGLKVSFKQDDCLGLCCSVLCS